MPSNKGKFRGRKPLRSRPVRRILIICEDSKSSRDYFSLFPYDTDQVEVECVGTGSNTDSLMRQAIRKVEQARKEGHAYERVWVVFDRDSFPLANFNRTFELAAPHREITPCWSNECFELWYLLHFNYRDTPIDRHQLSGMLSELLKVKYDKADETVWRKLKPRLETALRNGKRLAFENAKAGTPRANPSTRIHELIHALISLDPQRQSDG